MHCLSLFILSEILEEDTNAFFNLFKKADTGTRARNILIFLIAYSPVSWGINRRGLAGE